MMVMTAPESMTALTFGTPLMRASIVGTSGDPKWRGRRSCDEPENLYASTRDKAVRRSRNHGRTARPCSVARSAHSRLDSKLLLRYSSCDRFHAMLA